MYERHANRILGFCVCRLDSRDEAEDALQTTFVYALRALQRGVVPISETAWLFKIAENACLAAQRTKSRRRSHEAGEPIDLPDVTLSHRAEEREATRELVSVLREIPRNQRTALLLREWRGLSYREIGAFMHLSVSAVETLIFRARRSAAQARDRVAGVLDLGALLSTLKSAFGGAATVAKLGAVVAASALVTLPVADSARSPVPHPDRTTQPSRVVRSTAQAPRGPLARRAPDRQSVSHTGAPTQASKVRATAPTRLPRPAKPPETGFATVPVAPPAGRPSTPLVPAPPLEEVIDLPVQLPEPPAPELPGLPPLEPPSLELDLPVPPELPRLP